MGIDKISEKSYKEQGIEKVPTKHLGKFAHALEKKE
jgi:hypothetical protein